MLEVTFSFFLCLQINQCQYEAHLFVPPHVILPLSFHRTCPGFSPKIFLLRSIFHKDSRVYSLSLAITSQPREDGCKIRVRGDK